MGGAIGSTIHCDKSGHAYIMDSISGQAILLASADDLSATESAFAVLSTAAPCNSLHESMSAMDKFEYDTLLLEDHSVSVNWHKRKRDVSTDAFLASSLNTNSCTTLSASAGPFILNSGATHILPDASDFFNLKPIPPCIIKAIGSSSNNATGIGKICLCVVKGLEITLDPALFVPEVSVHLISVFILGSGPQKLISHFDEDGCWLTNSSGATVASGKFSAMGKHLYTLSMDSPLVEHSFIATGVLDIETWHHWLDHANYQSIVDMSDNGMIKDMHVNLSSMPPKCQSCILGKQTKTPVPKKQEGAWAKGILDIVYIDLTSLQPVQSASGFSYVMNLMGDVASCTYTYLLLLKSTTIKVLKEWVLLAE